MKIYWPLKFTCLLAGVLLLISSGKVSAQWLPGGGGDTFLDTIVISNSSAQINGIFITSDLTAIYSPFTMKGPAHYYQLTTPLVSSSTTVSPSIFTMTETVGFIPILTLLDANKNFLFSPPSYTVGVINQTETFNYTLASGSTYYIEASSIGGYGPFQLTIQNNVNTIVQCAQGMSGVAAGASSLNGSLVSSDAPSHARPGCFADYFTLSGIGVATLTSSGLDTFLYLYDANFKLVASNDDSNPPGFGGSSLKGLVLSKTGLTAGVKITTGAGTKINAVKATTSTGGGTTITIGSGTVIYNLDGTLTINAGVSTAITTGSAAITTGSGTIITTPNSTITTTGTSTITTGSGTAITPGNGAKIRTGADYAWNNTYTTVTTQNTAITSGNGLSKFISGNATTITTGSGTMSTINKYYVELTTYSKHATGSYTLSTTAGGLIQVLNPWDPSGDGSVNGSPVPLAYTTAGTLTSGTLSHARSGCYANYYQLLTSASGAGVTTITVSGFDSYLYVYNQKGSMIASNDDSNPPGGGGSRVNVTLAASTPYIVEVTSYFKGATNSYTLNISSNKSSGKVAPIKNPF